eukprot:6175683-Pleurochrysis_carterae.AAC.1
MSCDLLTLVGKTAGSWEVGEERRLEAREKRCTSTQAAASSSSADKGKTKATQQTPRASAATRE